MLNMLTVAGSNMISSAHALTSVHKLIRTHTLSSVLTQPETLRTVFARVTLGVRWGFYGRSVKFQIKLCHTSPHVKSYFEDENRKPKVHSNDFFFKLSCRRRSGLSGL